MLDLEAKHLGNKYQAIDVKQYLTDREIELGKIARDPHYKWDAQSNVGQKFYRESRYDAEWQKCKTAEDQQKFKQQWASKNYQSALKVKVYKKDFQRVDISMGEYMPVACILHKGGGANNTEAVAATARRVSKCFRMGEPWIHWNGLTERYDVLYMRTMCPLVSSHVNLIAQ